MTVDIKSDTRARANSHIDTCLSDLHGTLAPPTGIPVALLALLARASRLPDLPKLQVLITSGRGDRASIRTNGAAEDPRIVRRYIVDLLQGGV